LYTEVILPNTAGRNALLSTQGTVFHNIILQKEI